MPLVIRDGTNVPRTLTALQMRDGTNTPRTISELRVRDSSNVSRVIFTLAPPLSASASPYIVAGFTAGSGTSTTNSTTVTPVGGMAPYTYAWTLVSHTSPVAPTALSPTSATTTFRQTTIGPSQYLEASWSCLVTDALGNMATAECFSSWTDTTP